MKFGYGFFVLVAGSFLWLGWTEKKMVLANFSSDGCSIFSDGNFEDPELWKECCVLHDIPYWRGGSKKRRKQTKLSECV